MFKLLNKIYIIGVLCLAATPAFAKVCFLPDGNCEAGKATYSSVNNTTGCEYKDENAAKNGLGECQETYQSGMCYYRRCKMSESDCMKKANASVLGWLRWKRLGGSRIPPLSAIPYKCVVCKDGCWQLIRSSTPVIPEYTCRELGYKVKEDCTAEYVKFTPISLIDKNGERCGKCENLACMEMGGLKTEGSCAAGEKFVYANKIDGFNNKCGTCEAKTEPETCNVTKGEYDSLEACETNHPDTICTENSTSKCWIGKCDTRYNKYYFETKDVCYEKYQDECYDCNINPCEQVDEDTNCWFMDCEKMGFYSNESACKAKSTNCRFEDGLGCYMPDASKPDDIKCDEKQGLYASEYDCEHFGLEGPAYCYKEGNCYRPDVFRISAGWRYDHCGQIFPNESGCIDYGRLRFTSTNNAQRQYTLVVDSGKEIEIPAGSYTIKTTDYFWVANIGYCNISYINQLDLFGSEDEPVAYFNPQNRGDAQDLAQKNYAMTGVLKCEKGALGSHYEYDTQVYEFKGGITYFIGVYDTSIKCDNCGYKK